MEEAAAILGAAAAARRRIVVFGDYDVDGITAVAQLRAALVKKFGASWWTDPAAGAFLKPLLAPGNRLDADGLAKALGDRGVTPDAFVAAVVPRLSGTGPEGHPPAPKQPAPASPPPSPTSTAETPPAGAAAAAVAPASTRAGEMTAPPDAGTAETTGTK